MSETVDRAVRELPLLTRAQVMEEAEHDPGFWRYLAPLALSRDPARAVDEDMQRAAINALKPSRYREAGARWPMFRAKIQELRQRIADHADIYGSLSGFGQLLLPASASAIVAAAPAAPAANVWSTIGSVFSSLATTAGNIYATRITASAERQVSATQAQVAQAQAQAAIAPPPPQAAAGGSSVAVYALLALFGVGGLLFLMKAMGGR